MDHKHNHTPRREQKSEQTMRGALGNRGVPLPNHRSAHFYTTPSGGIRAICDAIPSLRSEQEAAASCAALRLSLWKKRQTKAEDAYEKNNAELVEQLTEKENELQCLQHRRQRMENRKQYLEKGERTKRNHRLITRGAAIEAIFPQVKPLTEVGFYTMVEILADLDDVQNVVNDAVQKHKDTMGGDA